MSDAPVQAAMPMNPSIREDDSFYASMIEALYGTPSAIIFGMMIINGIVLSAYFLSGDPVILGLACLLAAINTFRWFSHSLYNRKGRGSIDRALQRQFEIQALVGAWSTAATIGVFGAYTALAHTYQAASILGVAQTMGYLAGVAGRNNSRPYITQVQMALVSVTFIVGLMMTRELAYVLIGIAVAFTLLATLSSVRTIHEVFVSRVQSMRKLEVLAKSDSLTGLANRYALVDQMEKWHAAGKPFLLISIDLDNFKHVNDMFGYVMGDELLREAARRIGRHFVADDVVARVGGDEFLVLSQRTDAVMAMALATDVVNDLTLPFVVRNVRLRAGASIGIASSDGVAPETALKHADLALYRAKDLGKNQVCVYSPELGAKYDERILLEQDLRRAIENGELSLAFQPIVNPKSRRVTLVEALMRWQHPERGFISPGLFIPIAEASGLIGIMGTWALQTACHAAGSWPRDVGVSVNLSAKQFRRDLDLVSIVRSCLQSSGIAPERLTLEITESMLIDDADFVIETLERLRAMGVRTALDDFGTGYSSLSYLEKLPLDKIKIDRSFTTTIDTSARSASMLRGITALARDLQLEVIVEGIETEEQLNALSLLSIDGVQGYVFSRPVDGITLLPLLVHKVKTSPVLTTINHTRQKQASVG
jgi:diguanylate cyclase (GGDEF)-like protein